MVPIRAALAVILSLQAAVQGAGETPLSQGELQNIQRRFQQLQKNTRTFQARIAQSVGIEGMKKPVVSAGSLFYSRAGGVIRLDFERPRKESVLLTQNTVTLKRGDKPAETHKASEAKSTMMLRSLLGFFASGEPQIFPKGKMQAFRSGNQLKVVLQPENGDEQPRLPQKVETFLAWPDLEVRSLRIEMQKGTIQYDFSDIQRDAPLPAHLLEL